MCTCGIAASGRQLRVLEAKYKYSMKSFAFSPDGKTIAITTRGGQVQLWEAASGRQLWVNKGWSVAFSPDVVQLWEGD